MTQRFRPAGGIKKGDHQRVAPDFVRGWDPKESGFILGRRENNGTPAP